MKKIAPLLFLAALLCVLAACPGPMLDNSVAVGGTVTITRNGIPWNSDNFSPYGYSRDVGPPIDRPVIYAYSKGTDWVGGRWIGSASVYYQPDGDDYRNGTYQWTLKIPPDMLPCSVYFDVMCHMRDIESLPSTRKEFWIQDENTVVDIGIINFDVVRLSGNLPITINGEPLVENASRQMKVFDPQNVHNMSEWDVYPSWKVYISPNGDWSLNIPQPDSEISLGFQLEVTQNGGFLRKMLNADNAITVYDTDKEIVFPDYPSVNFEAFHLSGIIEVVSPGTGESRYYSIEFFREGTEWDDHGDYYPRNYLLSDTTTGWSASGLKKWKTTIPVLELPHELHYTFVFVKGPNGYRGHSSVLITADTDLSNIDLGVFTFE